MALSQFEYLSQAARDGDIEIIQRHCVEVVTETGPCGRTVLFAAAEACCLEAVQYLVSLGADVNVRDTAGWSPIYVAARAKGVGLDTVLFLAQNGALLYSTDNTWNIVNMVSEQGDLEILQYLVESRSVDVDLVDSNGWGPLIWAISRKHHTVIQYLCEHGASMDIGDNEGRTPLYWAAKGGSVSIVRKLIEHGADVNTTDKTGVSALGLALEGGYSNVAELLKEAGAEYKNIKEI